MAEYCTEEIASACGGKLYKSGPEQPVKNIITDSRKFSFPGDSIFVALKGERNDGHNYLEDLYRHHVRNYLVEYLPEEIQRFEGSSFIVVPDTLRALQKMAAMHRGSFGLPVIAITGSNGKTILKEWLFQLLSHDKVIVRSPKSYNSQIGVPLSVWQIESYHELAIFEAGISRPGEMAYLEPVIKPDIGILTNIGPAHQENFTDFETKLAEKMQLFKNCRSLLYCRDHRIIDDFVRNSGISEGKRIFSWSRSEKADLRVKKISIFEGVTKISASFRGEDNLVTIPFADRASAENAIHAWAAMLMLGYEHDYIEKNMKELAPVAMRLEQKQGINNCTVINDSYNSDPVSLGIAMDFLTRQTAQPEKMVILSDMFETGRRSSELYRDIGEILTREKTGSLVGIGSEIRQIEPFFSGRVEFYDSTEDFARAFDPYKFQNTAILVKGSRRYGFERISNLLEEKTHATVLEINLGNLIRNFNYFKSLLYPRTMVMAVVKAFSYGSGGYQIASALAHNHVDYLAVAFTDEGVELRKKGISVPVMVMNPDLSECGRMVEHSLEPEIFSLGGLDLFIDRMRETGIKNYPVHLKLDTGMNRLGFTVRDISALTKRITRCDTIRVVSVFSHLAAADDPSQDDFTREQIRLFRKLAASVKEALGYPVITHILNSAGIERFPEAGFDMVRLGIGLYGISVLDNNKLANVSTFRSVISQVKEVPAGNTIGYSRAYKATDNMRVAVVPVGYADGLDRRLGNGTGRMVVNGVKVPIVGNICMDMCMVDITGTDAGEGDQITVFGDDNSIDDLAGLLSTIPYEIFVKISARVRRIYVQE